MRVTLYTLLFNAKAKFYNFTDRGQVILAVLVLCLFVYILMLWLHKNINYYDLKSGAHDCLYTSKYVPAFPF